MENGKFSERDRKTEGSLILYSTVSSTVSAVSTPSSVSSFPSSSTGGLRYSSSLTACGSGYGNQAIPVPAGWSLPMITFFFKFKGDGLSYHG